MNGCYTAARYQAGRVRHALRHARRLRRDAAVLGLAAPPEGEIEEMLRAVGREFAGDGACIVRLALRHSAAGGGGLPFADAREIGPEPEIWTAIRFDGVHPGPEGTPGAKREGVSVHARGRDAARAAGVDEALLFGAAGFLVEGARTNVFVVRADGALVTPPLGGGAVAGIAREIVLERVPDAREAEIGAEDLLAAREVIVTNAARGARPLRTLDGRPLGSAAGAGRAASLHAILLSDPPPA